MKDVTTGNTSTCESGTDWDKLLNMSDDAIRAGIELDSDAHPTDEAFWRDAKGILPSRKEIVTMRLDADLFE